MVLNPEDAADITQEILIKIFTNLHSFRGEAKFETWLYRITVNYILKMKKRKMENIVTGFPVYFAGLESIPDQTLSPLEKITFKETVKDVKISCTAGMLLCLERENRLIFVMAEIFGIDHRQGAEIFQLTPSNFRKRLSRSRNELYNWMNNKCGLVNKSNPCRCPKKTKGFISLGWVDPKSLKFNSDYKHNIEKIAQDRSEEDCTESVEKYRAIFRNHPFQERDSLDKALKNILSDKSLSHLHLTKDSMPVKKIQKEDRIMKRLGPKTIAWLNQVGINSGEQILKIGVIDTYLILKKSIPRISLNMLWGLQAAVLDIDWRDIPSEVKDQLKEKLLEMEIR